MPRPASVPAGTPYIVSELLEGQSLRARLDGAALPLRKAIEFGIQIAEGLAAAHDKGIVHRDLKPENIFVTSEERLKILDFGLAKLVALDSATLTAAPHTSAGVVLGTVGYLSPEQASGLPADHRSDIFSVGAMLFEMVTHRRAFARATAAQTLTAVLEDDPTASIEVDAGPSARVMNLVRRCLDKSVERRFQSARDLALVLANELADGSLGQPRFARLRVPRLTTRRSTFGWAVMLGVATLALSAYLFSPAREGARQEIRLQLSAPTGMRFVSAPAFSPDGSQMVFAAVAHTGGAARLGLRPFAAPVPTERPGTEGGSYPFWSADSRSSVSSRMASSNAWPSPAATPSLSATRPRAAAGCGSMTTRLCSRRRRSRRWCASTPLADLQRHGQRSPMTRRGTGFRNAFPAANCCISP